jgi:hypothetical protein
MRKNSSTCKQEKGRELAFRECRSQGGVLEMHTEELQNISFIHATERTDEDAYLFHADL